ncbi:MAG TPA: hypothetical protein VID24_05160 [Candidatus Eremiobacteraceae bacterium]|jgi:hypothetical protein
MTATRRSNPTSKHLGGPAGLIAGGLYASSKKTNASLRQGSVVVAEVRRSVAQLSSGTVA